MLTMRNRCLSPAFARILMALTVGGFLTGAGPLFAAEIVVGQVGPMSGPEAGQGRAYAAGMQLHFTALNKAGGVNGHKFTLLRKDDGGVPGDTVALTRQMMAEDKPLVLAGYFGGKNVADLVSAGILEKEKIPLVGYRTSEIQPDAPYLYGVRAGLRDEISKLVEHLATIGIKRLGLFHEAGPGSTAAIAAAEDAARKVNVTDAVDTFINMQPQAIIMISSGAAAAGFIEKYRIAGGAAQLLAHSGADIEQLSKRLSPEQMQGVAIAQVVPSPYKVSSPLVKDFTDTAAKARTLEVPVSYAMMEGYIAARVISEAIRRQGGRPSREGTVLALDSMSSFDLGGYLISFKPGQHSGSSFVELSIVTSAGRIRQ
jgi:ABC-type branched-subunit amino acid transport system substrate-binding protein